MSATESNGGRCVVIGASHAGVNFAFALRKEGWEGEIQLFDADPMRPYHRPPLSKAYLAGTDKIEKNLLKAEESYEREKIDLHLGIKVAAIKPGERTIQLDDGRRVAYDKLVLATGARPLLPPIVGIEACSRVSVLRTASDVEHIRNKVKEQVSSRVVIIGGGYIGLETASSLSKMGASVVVLEREERILARVTAPFMSDYFQRLHAAHGVSVLTSKNVVSIGSSRECGIVICDDGSQYPAELVIVGVGIQVNQELAEQAGLIVENGIRVDGRAQTSDPAIYAIGDCTNHFNLHYQRFVRLESVQNAVDQAKVAAAAIAGKQPVYDALPWFWSDQFDTKLQIAGLSAGYNRILTRIEHAHCFSVWYFKDDTLLAVDAVNHAKSYVVGTKLLKDKQKVDVARLTDRNIDLKVANLILE
ncbi:NAD(P)/FAD-dependent oxidoreductase [Dyadobacter tibetensis]|uniref:NAD(P)/FAD-dependent oxidoreductase n=1 Tax=Dyadobacter tibetensis TaxID=1211851 RepID=UPI000471ED83|nr:FAD-dependent oxidoreductase [Dyadobacter tibetensis]